MEIIGNTKLEHSWFEKNTQLALLPVRLVLCPCIPRR